MADGLHLKMTSLPVPDSAKQTPMIGPSVVLAAAKKPAIQHSIVYGVEGAVRKHGFQRSIKYITPPLLEAVAPVNAPNELKSV